MSANMDLGDPSPQVLVPFHLVLVPFHLVLVPFHLVQDPFHLAQVPSLVQDPFQDHGEAPFHVWCPEVLDQVKERTRRAHVTGLVEVGVAQEDGGRDGMASAPSGLRTGTHPLQSLGEGASHDR